MPSLGGEKQCSRCGERKPLTEFYADRRVRSGIKAGCKECHRTHVREYGRMKYNNDDQYRERVLARGRRRYQENRHDSVFMDRQRARCRDAYRRKGEHRDTSKVVARRALNRAVNVGKVTPLGWCEDCGHDFTNYRREAHHSDYTKPLDVRWICSRCHGLLHTQGGALTP